MREMDGPPGVACRNPVGMKKLPLLSAGFDSPPSTTFSPGSELVPLEGLRVFGALHGNEAETQKLPGPRQGQLSLFLTSLIPQYDCRALRGRAREEPVCLYCLAHQGGLLYHDLTAPCLQGGGEGLVTEQ